MRKGVKIEPGKRKGVQSSVWRKGASQKNPGGTKKEKDTYLGESIPWNKVAGK